MMFEIEKSYSKEDIYQLVKVPAGLRGGNWDTGYTRYEGLMFIFCNIGVAGRTGHNYPNAWRGNDLVWFGKTNTHLNQPLISGLINSLHPVLIFTREADRSPFKFEGWGSVKEYYDQTPIKIIWSIRPEVI